MTPQSSILDARLAELDQRLRTIQAGLADDRRSEPAARRPPAPPELPPRVEIPRLTREPAAVDLIAELRSLAATQERLLASLHKLAQIPAGSRDAPDGVVAITVGPLPSTGALRAFERALSGLEGVTSVRVRGYEGGDRALLDVYLT